MQTVDFDLKTNEKKILIVEDSNLFANLLKKRVAAEFSIPCDVRGSYQEAADCLKQCSTDYLLAILDLTLPGSPDGEIVDLVISSGIPVVVVSARMNEQIRETILEKRIFDYIMKGPHTLDLLSATIRRYLRNQQISVLVVEDSALVMDTTLSILKTQHFNILEATNGEEALAHLSNNQTIKLILTDYNMPIMDGFELTAEVRKRYAMDSVAIIGMSTHGNPLLSSQFLKRGANDFINKPYFEEELVWRVNQNVELLDNIARLRDAAIKDVLTGLYNRRYFYQTGEKLFANILRTGTSFGIAMVDIDHFKKVNDTFGHDCGDQVLSAVAKTLQKSFRDSDIVARCGGEEFVILAPNMTAEHIQDHFEAVRRKIEALTIKTEQHEIQTTVSIGITTKQETTLEAAVKAADGLLYKAKESGRNCCLVQ